jgi:hypothetical protein
MMTSTEYYGVCECTDDGECGPCQHREADLRDAEDEAAQMREIIRAGAEAQALNEYLHEMFDSEDENGDAIPF